MEEFLAFIIYAISIFSVVAFLVSIIAALVIFKSKKAKAAATIIVISMWSVLWHRKIEVPQNKMRQREALYSEKLRRCRNDLSTISKAFSVDSLFVESGSIETSKLKELIGERGLKFIELQPKQFIDEKKGAQFFVAGVQGDDFYPIYVDPKVKVVRVSLSLVGDAACRSQENLGLNHSNEGAPFSPDACFRFDFDEQSHASHALKAVPIPGAPKFIKWTLSNQSSGEVLAALSSADDPKRPERQGGGSPEDKKNIGDDEVSCLQPHFSLMNLLYGASTKPEGRLALGRRAVIAHPNLDALGEAASWPSTTAIEEDVPDWNTDAYNEARNLFSWKAAFLEAKKTGWAGYGESVVDFNSGEIISLRSWNPTDGYVVGTRGTKEGYMVVLRGVKEKPNAVPILHYSLEGKLLSKRLLISNREFPKNTGPFSPIGTEWKDGQLRVYGLRLHLDNHQSDVTVLRASN